MQDVSPSRVPIRFSVFEIDLCIGELRKQGVKVKLQEQPFQVLQALLERPGEVVTREELRQRIWLADTFVDFDHGLYNAIKRLREALGDSADTPRFIETVPKRGYRFIGVVEGNDDVSFGISEELPDATVRRAALIRRRVAIATATVLIALAATLAFFGRRPPTSPVVETITQLTNDFVPKQLSPVTDGSRIYFNEGATGSWNIAQVSVSGGATSVVSTTLDDPQVVGIAPDGSSLLAYAGEGSASGLRSLWTIRMPNGEARRLGAIDAQSASIFPDRRLLFGQGVALYVADEDGSSVRQLLTSPGPVPCITISPDGKLAAFGTYGALNAFFEAKTNGSAMHEILRGTDEAGLGCPHWTQDGKYLVYTVVHPERSDIWVAAVPTGFSRDFTHLTQLTNGPLSYEDATPSPDGKHIFALGTAAHGELVRYDLKTKQFVPFLGGISAIDPSFSRDGQWVAYTSYSDHTLWRSRSDGRDRLQLTYAPMQVSFPIISPGGTQVAFMTHRGETYVIGMDGSSLRRVAEKNSGGGSLSPDGNSIVLTLAIEGKRGEDRNVWQLKTLDLRNGRLADVPSSQGRVGVFWISQDALVAANEDFNKLLTFSFKDGKWTELVSGAIVNWMPSPDGKYVYYATGGPEPKAMRVRLTDRKVEEIVSLKGLRRVVDTVDFSTQMSVAPDGSPIFTRDLGTQEIYALTVKWP